VRELGRPEAAPPAPPAARPQLIRSMNEQAMLDHIRWSGPVSRADLARISGLSKPTVSQVLGSLERSGLVRTAGTRTGVPGPAAVLYEVRPDAGHVLALDVGREYLRGALSDLSGAVVAHESAPTTATHGPGRMKDLVSLAERLVDAGGIPLAAVTQTVLGSPGVYDPRRDALSLTGALPGWDRPSVLSDLRERFGASLMLENDVDAAALAELAHGHGRDVDTFAFVSVGTGVGMGLVLNGRLHRGAHGAAGEIGFMPLSDGTGSDERDARRRGTLEAAASAAAVVRAARRAGMGGALTARKVFTAAASGDARAAEVVAAEARLVARAIAAVVTVVDPPLVVLGGGIGQAPGFVEAVDAELRATAPVQLELRASALGADAVVDGCLAAGTERAWELVRAGLLPSHT
jgi:predicted NBD/HSP70 family sugar kinase